MFYFLPLCFPVVVLTLYFGLSFLGHHWRPGRGGLGWCRWSSHTQDKWRWWGVLWCWRMSGWGTATRNSWGSVRWGRGRCSRSRTVSGPCVYACGQPVDSCPRNTCHTAHTCGVYRQCVYACAPLNERFVEIVFHTVHTWKVSRQYESVYVFLKCFCA